ncbi:MAG: diacylglycerol kinase family lipid kinase [Anaerolineales bacterium]|nr:diacylglycerol kinase family lipid kinase [Anaerolineales bacterium]
MTPLIILNPYSNRWQAKARRQDIEAALATLSFPAEIVETNAPGHGIELAAQATAAGRAPIIAAGGDGTLSEVINGMMKGNPHPDQPIGPYGILPVGTANDLGDQLEIPREMSKALAVIAQGKTRKIDLCQINDRYFVNNAGLGLEPYITLLQARMKRLNGVPRYMAAALLGIMHHPTWKMHLEWDNGTYSGPMTLISIGNWARTGGVFYTVPHAAADDGLLTFTYAHIPTRLKTLFALPMIMKAGKGNITEHPMVHEVNATWLKVRSETLTPAHADGEVFAHGIQEIEFRILPRKLEVLVP